MEQFPIADAHCDFLYGMYKLGYDIKALTQEQTICLPLLKAGGVKLQFFAAWIDKLYNVPYLQQCICMIDAYYRMLQEHADEMGPLTKTWPADSGKIATVLTVEGGEAIEGSLSVLRVLKRLGVSAMTLTWNNNNELAGAAIRKNNKGLSALGKAVIKEMEQTGIAVDVSHLSDAGINDVLAMAVRPVFASHSNARSICDSPRALTDEYIKAIAESGGVVGVNFYHKQLSQKGNASIKDIVRHIEHIVSVGGVDCCCIGSDFDGMTNYPDDLKNSADIPCLLMALKTHGFTDEDIYKIAYGNLYQYILEFV